MIIRCREFVYVSNYRLKIPIVNHLFSDRTDGTDQGRQSVLKSEGNRLENEEVRGYASLIF